MIALKGIYKNGKVDLEQEVKPDTSYNVIVTFLEEDQTDMKPAGLRIEDFSFSKTRAALQKYKTSISEAVIQERRSAHLW